MSESRFRWILMRVFGATKVAGLLILAVASLGLFQNGVFAQGSQALRIMRESAEEVLAFEKRIEEAVLQADVAFLDGVCTSDFTYTHGDGWTTGGKTLGVDSKSEWLASLPGRYASRVVDSQHVEIHGDVAITMGRLRAQTGKNSAARRSFSFWYIRVYRRLGDDWQYLSHRTVHGPVYDR